jgi:DNA-binding Lrp family transcriptional regulator
MAIGFVLIRTSPGKEREVFERLLEVRSIIELHPLFGEYDIIAKVNAEDFQVLGEAIVDTVRTIPGVIETRTLTGVSL